jgi:zinc transporter
LREVRYTLVDLRRVAISLRRYVAPQRDALNRLSQLDEAWLDERVRGRLRETVDHVTRITEQLDEVRERSAVVQDELMNRLSQRMERTMYVLTVVATIMLPLGFLTGLLGINVAGIPGTETSWAFWAVCGILAAVAVVEVWVLRRLKWL